MSVSKSDWPFGYLEGEEAYPELKDIPAYDVGNGFRGPDDIELLRQALDPNCDIFLNIIVRGRYGERLGLLPGRTIADVARLLHRVQKLLMHFEPTTSKDMDSLRLAIRRFGVNRALPEQKGERSR